METYTKEGDNIKITKSGIMSTEQINRSIENLEANNKRLTANNDAQIKKLKELLLIMNNPLE